MHPLVSPTKPAELKPGEVIVHDEPGVMLTRYFEPTFTVR
jgi:hypothetical protein